jgi:hypothetical protein
MVDGGCGCDGDDGSEGDGNIDDDSDDDIGSHKDEVDSGAVSALKDLQDSDDCVDLRKSMHRRACALGSA